MKLIRREWKDNLAQIRDEFKEMNVKRKSEGLRAKQKNSLLARWTLLQLER